MNHLPDKEATFEKRPKMMKRMFSASSPLMRRMINIVYVPELIASSSLLKMTLNLSLEFFTVH